MIYLNLYEMCVRSDQFFKIACRRALITIDATTKFISISKFCPTVTVRFCLSVNPRLSLYISEFQR